MMKTKLAQLTLTAACLLLLAACNTSREVPYMIDADQLPQEVLNASARAQDPTLMPGDLLMINVSSSNMEAVAPFNRGEYIASGNGTARTGQGQLYSYLVDSNGDIEFPLVGRIHVAGMTKTATEDYIASLIYPRYLTEKPGVEVRVQNFKVYTIGEFGSPGVVSASNGRLNLLEAIAQSGDLTLQGKRNNIMIVRTDASGNRQIKRVNINDPKFLTSPDFYLQQNDIIYCEPNASKARRSWNVPPVWSLTVSSIGTLMSITTFIIALSNKL